MSVHTLCLSYRAPRARPTEMIRRRLFQARRTTNTELESSRVNQPLSPNSQDHVSTLISFRASLNCSVLLPPTPPPSVSHHRALRSTSFLLRRRSIPPAPRACPSRRKTRRAGASWACLALQATSARGAGTTATAWGPTRTTLPCVPGATG